MGMGTRALVLAAAVAAPAVAFAGEIHVPGDHRRLADALAAALPGDTIVVDSGVHRGPFVVLTDDLVIEGRGGRLALRGAALRSRSPEDDAVLSVRADRVTLRTLPLRRGGIRIEGDGALVDRCTVERAGDRRHAALGVEVLGDGARIRDCVLRGGRGRFQGVRATGAGNTVERTEVSAVRGGLGIELSGVGAEASSNLVLDLRGSEAIAVHGDEAVVADNGLDVVASDGSGLLVDGDRAVVSRNRVVAGALEGASILLEGSDGLLSESWVAAADRTGIVVRGDRNLVEDNEVFGDVFLEGTGTFGHGIVVRGSGNALRDNYLWAAPADGFRILGGQGNVIEQCTVDRSGACGLLNAAVGTSVMWSWFVSSGTDVLNAGSFTAFGWNVFETGTSDPTGFGGSLGLEEDFGIEMEDVGGDRWIGIGIGD